MPIDEKNIRLCPGDTLEAAKAFADRLLAASRKVEKQEQEEALKAQMEAEALCATQRETRSATGDLPARRYSLEGAGVDSEKWSDGAGSKKRKLNSGSESEDAEFFLPLQSNPTRQSVAPRRTRKGTVDLTEDDEGAGVANQDEGELELSDDESNDVDCSSEATQIESLCMSPTSACGESSGEETPIPMSVGRVSDGVYHLEKLLDVRIAHKIEVSKLERMNGIDYKVKWKGWPETYNWWETASALNAEYFKTRFWRNMLARSESKNTLNSSELYAIEPPDPKIFSKDRERDVLNIMI